MDPRSYVFPCSFQRIATERNDVHGPSDGGSLGGFGFEGEVTSFGGTLGRMNGVAAMANQPTPVYNPTNHVFFFIAQLKILKYIKKYPYRGDFVSVFEFGYKLRLPFSSTQINKCLAKKQL